MVKHKKTSGRTPIGRLTARARDKRRRAAAVVEFAFVLPLLVTILFGIIEYGWMFMVRQALMNAAREGCRVAVLSTTEEPYTEVTERVNEVMAPMGITVSIEMSHATLDDPVEAVTVKVPAADVTLMGSFFGDKDYNLTGNCSMRKEGIGDSE